MKKNNLGQGTIEYLVIVGIIVVLSLIVVGILTNSSDSARNTLFSSDNLKQNVGVSGISITESIAGNDANGILVLQNNSGDTIQIEKVTIDTVDHNYSVSIPALGKISLKLTSIIACSQEEQEYEIKIDYSSNGINKIADFGKIKMNCVTQTITNTQNFVEEIITPHIHFCGEEAQEGTTEINSCGTYITEPGVYTLMENLSASGTCIYIWADDVTLIGNSCEIEGDINASARNEGANAFNNVHLENIKINGNVHAKGGDSVNDGGSGGRIYLSDMNVTGEVNTSGGLGDSDFDQYGQGGNGGDIIVADSNLNVIFTSGGSGWYGGITGDVAVENSIIHTIWANGATAELGNDGAPAGNVTINDSTILYQINAYGGGGVIGGNGGTINITNSEVIDSILASGGTGYGTSGAGGIVLIENSTVGEIVAQANDCLGSGSIGGDGGVVTLNNSTATAIYASAGGGCDIIGTSNGGTITLTDSTIISSIIANGGNPTSGTGGTINITNSIIGGTITANAGYGFETGGTGGNITITGTQSQTGNCSANGGDSYNEIQAGNGGTITINPTCPTLGNIGLFTCIGGEPNGTSGTCPHTCS